MEDMLVSSKHFDTERCKKLSLDELSCSELKILLERQQKLLHNSSIISNLPDRGERIRLYISSIEEAIRVRGTYEGAIQALSELKIEETKSPVCSPLVRPNTSPRKSLSDSIDNDKLDKVRSKLASRPSPKITQLLSGSDGEELVRRDREKVERLGEAEIKLEDFLGLFKVGSVKVESQEGDTDDIYISDSTLRGDPKVDIYAHSDSEVSDQSDASTASEDIGEMYHD